MSENTEIVLPQEIIAEGLAKYDQSVFDAVSKSSDFLPRLQLYGGNSEAVKAQLIHIAHYGLQHSADKIDDLGQQVDIVNIVWRPKALRISDDNVMSYFDIKNPEFAKVQAESNVQDSGCMFGPEFLVWVPVKKAFATFYMGSKTARRESPSMLPLTGKKVTLKNKLIKGAKFSWHGPIVLPCTTEIAALPDPEVLKEQVEKFTNPKDSVIEKVEEAAAEGGRER